MNYYNNIICINGASDDGWRMVLPRPDQTKIGKPTDSKKSSNFHNYFVFEGRNCDRVKKIPVIGKAKPNVATDSTFKQQVSFP